MNVNFKDTSDENLEYLRKEGLSPMELKLDRTIFTKTVTEKNKVKEAKHMYKASLKKVEVIKCSKNEVTNSIKE